MPHETVKRLYQQAHRRVAKRKEPVECSAKTVVEYFPVYQFLIPHLQLFAQENRASHRSFAKGSQGKKDIAHGQAERHCSSIPKEFAMRHDP